MPFPLIDRITELDPAAGRIRASKVLSLAEEYLQDHFPRFPVMPGVLALEAIYQASAYLVLWRDEFRRPAVSLAEARNIKYAEFVMPGDRLVIESHWLRELDEERVLLRAEGRVRGAVAVSGRLVVRRTLGDALGEAARQRTRELLRRRIELIWRPEGAAAGEG